MVACLGALLACRDSTEPPTSIPVEFRVSADIGPGEPARSVTIIAHYRRTAGQQIALPVNPATIDAATGSVAAGTVSVDVLPCLSDPNREPMSGTETNGCRVYLVARLRAPNGTPVSEEEIVVPVARSARAVTVEPFTLPSGALVPSTASVELIMAGSGALPAPVTVGIASSTVLQGGPLTASIQYLSGAGWLTATVAPEGNAVTIAPDQVAMAPGVYDAIVRVTSAGMFEPAEIAVRYEVPHPPKVVTIAGAGNGTGLVLATPSGASCTTTAGQLSGICTVPSPHGSIVELTPAPAVGSAFTSWSGACQGTGACILTMSQDRAVTATFTILKRDLVVDAAGAGSGTISSSPAGIACSGTAGAESGSCAAQFDHPTQVTLTAAPNTATSTFAGWSGACTGTGGCVVTMTEARAVTATFALAQRQLTVSMSGGGSGTVTSSPGGLACTTDGTQTSGTCSAAFDHGTVVVLTANPATGTTFTGWAGACSGTGTCAVTMDQARSVTAAFQPPLHALTVTMTGNGRGFVSFGAGTDGCTYNGPTTTSCVREFPAGTTVTVTASTDLWFGSATLTGPMCFGGGLPTVTCQVVMDGPKAITASFPVAAMRIIVSGSGMGSGTVTSEPGGISCTITAGQTSGTCDASLIRTTGYSRVLLHATPAVGSIFSGFTGCQMESERTCSFRWGSDTSASATFHTAAPLTITGIGNGRGRVDFVPSRPSCTLEAGVACTHEFPAGSVVSIHATPEDQFTTFDGFSVHCIQGPGGCQFTLNGPTQATASFTRGTRPPAIAILGAGSGAGTVTGASGGIDCRIEAGYTAGRCGWSFLDTNPVILTATPRAGSTFAGWTGCPSPSGVTCTVPRNTTTVTARFELSQPAVSSKPVPDDNR